MAVFILVFFLLLIAYGFLVDYYRRAWNAMPEYDRQQEPVEVKISVIIPVRNEKANMARLAAALATQDYPKYEVLIVDDHSEDGGPDGIVEDVIRIIRLPENVSGKKYAIAEGIKNASGELIVTTDADCDMQATWLSTIASFYVAANAQFIAAPVKMESGKSVLGIFQSLDFLTMQGITGASVYKHLHTMCNGANLAYTKQAFNEVEGFKGIDKIPSGDDMLLMHKIYSLDPLKVFYLKKKDAIVVTPAEKTWKDFFNQRIRWASKAVHYKDKRIIYVLLLTYLVNLFFLVCFIAAFFDIKWAAFFVLFLLAKILIEFPFVNTVSRFFGQQWLMKYFIILQPVHILYIIISGWLGRFGSYTWKNRKIFNFKDGSTARK